MKNRVQAFTIMEVSITMLLAAIAIGITYTVYTIVSRSYTAYNIKNNNLSSLIRLNELFKNDFERSDLIVRNENDIKFKREGQIVTYKIDPEFIVRTSGIIDTFKIKTQSVDASFEHNLVSENPIEEDQNRIDELQINLLYENKKIPYHYHKQYSAVNLIQKNTNALN